MESWGLAAAVVLRLCVATVEGVLLNLGSPRRTHLWSATDTLGMPTLGTLLTPQSGPAATSAAGTVVVRALATGLVRTHRSIMSQKVLMG